MRVLARLFRRRFLAGLEAAFAAGDLKFFNALASLAQPAAFARRLAELRSQDWVVYAKRPFGGPEQVLAYLGRYTHRVAIANTRLVALEDGQVSFRWKDYRHHDKPKLMTLGAEEFLRRFLLHALPDGFHRIRHYGLLANHQRGAKLALCRRLLDVEAPQAPIKLGYREHVRQLTGRALDVCRLCGGTMIAIGRRSAQQLAAHTPMWCDSS